MIKDPKNTDARIVSVDTVTQEYAYRTPMKFGGRVVEGVILRDVIMEVETRGGLRGRGFGSMPVGNVWGWPSDTLTADETLNAMTRMGEHLVSRVAEHKGWGHPLEITKDWAGYYDAAAEETGRELRLPEQMPKLARLVVASPFEAAVHDAYGKALGKNSYDLLGKEFVNADLGHFLAPEFAGEYLDAYTLRRPKERMPLYHLVGALDPLTEQDIAQRLRDGLPETLPEWILANGLTHLKIKLNGDDLDWDVQRVVAVDRVT
ncbi:MAG: hypothetical protein GYA33_06305, partial [Thermogutta sp.]|nr:hypothetical protein [Thermogutta sp.]